MQSITSDWLLIVIALSLVGAGAWLMKWLASRAFKGLDDGQTEIKNTLQRIEEKIVGKEVCHLRHENVRLIQEAQQREIEVLKKEKKGI
jgi:hypothetical protein